MTKEEQAREEIARISFNKWEYHRRGSKHLPWEDEDFPGIKQIYYEFADQILNNPAVAQYFRERYVKLPDATHLYPPASDFCQVIKEK